MDRSPIVTTMADGGFWCAEPRLTYPEDKGFHMAGHWWEHVTPFVQRLVIVWRRKKGLTLRRGLIFGLKFPKNASKNDTWPKKAETETTHLKQPMQLLGSKCYFSRRRDTYPKGKRKIIDLEAPFTVQAVSSMVPVVFGVSPKTRM